jgi:putative transposase
MRKAYKYRLYPTKEQKATLEHTLNTCKILYNNALAERKEAWEKEKRNVTCSQQRKQLSELKKTNPFLPKVHAHVLQDMLIRLDRTFQAFFRRVKNGEKPGYPRFKSIHRYHSFTFFEYGNGAKITGRKLMLSKVGVVSIKLHRTIEGKIKTCTIRKDVDRWYACFSVELPDAPKQKVKSVVGVDVGLESIVTLSTGEKVGPPKFLKRSENRLVREQRRLSRKAKGSKNRAKQRLKVARLHRKVREQRLDFMHKLSRDLVERFDLIVFEDLRIRNMLKNHYLAKSISDAAWYLLQGLTVYKAGWAGKHTAFAMPNGTSQECCVCGAVMNLTLADRTFRCTSCGNVRDRDHNAAINIFKRVGRGTPEFTPVES